MILASIIWLYRNHLSHKNYPSHQRSCIAMSPIHGRCVYRGLALQLAITNCTDAGDKNIPLLWGIVCFTGIL